MKLLLVAATPFEIQPFISEWESAELRKVIELDVLVTGVGMVATAFALGKKLAVESYDLAINAGIAGSFNRELELGAVVNIKQDRLVELGAEDNDAFLSIEDLGFGESAFSSTFNHPFLEAIKSVSAITVNKVHGSAGSIARTASLFNPEVESMEGAAFFYGCKQVGLPCIQIRSISNYVEPRNRESWNIPTAIKSLNDFLIRFIHQLSASQAPKSVFPDSK